MKQHTLRGRLRRIGLIAALVFPVLTACGGGSGSSADMPARPTIISSLAGYPLSEGNQDGSTSTTASFSSSVQGMALTSSGEVVIADTNNNLIRKLSANYEQVSTLAGGYVPFGAIPGTASSADGNGKNAGFYHPAAVVVDTAGNTYVADTANHLVRKISPAGTVTTLAGQAGVCGNQDGVGNAATLCNPSSIAVDKTGTVFVAEARLLSQDGAGRIRKITVDGAVSTFVGKTSGMTPLLATDSAGTLYAADARRILRYAANGQATVVTGTEGQLGNTIVAITFDSADRLFVLDKEKVIGIPMLGMLGGPISVRYVRLGIRHVGSDGRVTTLVSAPSDCHNFDGRDNDDLCQATTMVAKADGQFLVAESIGAGYDPYAYVRLRNYTQQGSYTVVAAGPVSRFGAKDGQGDAARFNRPSALAFDPSGTLHVRDGFVVTRSVTIRTVQADGLVATLGQPGGRCTSITGLGEEFLSGGVAAGPGSALAADGAGNLYTYIDSRILKMRNCEAVLLADVNPYPSTGTGRPFAPLTGIAADTAGNVYASSYQGVIFKIDTKGTVTLFTGSEAQWGHRDGQGQAARFSWLGNMTTDAAGNLYVVDSLNYFMSLGPTIRKITPSGLVSTLAGNPDAAPGHADGRGTAARFSVNWQSPSDMRDASLAVDNKGNVYVSDPANSVIRKITPDGQVSTPVGQVGQRGFAAVDLPGSIGRPSGIAIRDSKLYITVPHAVLQVRLPD